MSGELLVPEGIPLPLRFSKGERNASFNGLLEPLGALRPRTSSGTPYNAGTAVSPAFPNFEGDSRPQGPAWDIGADEYNALGAPPALTVISVQPAPQLAFVGHHAPGQGDPARRIGPVEPQRHLAERSHPHSRRVPPPHLRFGDGARAGESLIAKSKRKTRFSVPSLRCRRASSCRRCPQPEYYSAEGLDATDARRCLPNGTHTQMPFRPSCASTCATADGGLKLKSPSQQVRMPPRKHLLYVSDRADVGIKLVSVYKYIFIFAFESLNMVALGLPNTCVR